MAGASQPRSLSDDEIAQINAINNTSSYCRTLFFSYLALGATLFILVSGTTHEDLLRETPVKMPLFDIGVPLLTFYTVAPLLFVLFHVNLLNKLSQLRKQIENLDGAEKEDIRGRLFPFDYALLFGGFEQDTKEKAVLWTIVGSTLFVMPVLLLLYAQYQFLAYHSGSITALHSVLVTFDLGALVFFHLKPNEFPSSQSTASTFVALASWFGLVTPDTMFDQPGTRSFWENEASALGLHRNLQLSGQTFWASDPPPENVAAYETEHGFNDETKRAAQLRYGRPMDLRRRDLRYANLAGSKLINAVLVNTQLQGANLDDAHLQGADLSGAQLEGANLELVKLHDASLQRAVLSRASLPYAQLQGADMEGAKIDGSNMVGASLQNAELRHIWARSADLRSAKFQGARLYNSFLMGADLSAARLEGVDLKLARLQGADLVSAQLQGANLSRAQLQGANLTSARLQGANLTSAQLQGAVIWAGQLQGADLRDTQLQLADLSRVQLQGADLSRAQLQGAKLKLAQLQGAKLKLAQLQGANLSDTQLQGADFSGAQLQGADLSRAKLQGADLRVAQLRGVSLYSAQLQGVDFAVARLEWADLSRANARFPLEEERDAFWSALRWLAGTVPEGTRRDQMLERINAAADRNPAPEFGPPNSFVERTKHSLMGDADIFQDWPVHISNSDYEAGLPALLANLACEDSYTANGIALHRTPGVGHVHARDLAIARRFLSHECMRGTTLKDTLSNESIDRLNRVTDRAQWQPGPASDEDGG